MCGIAGIWSKSGKPVSQDNLKIMSKQLFHRGPEANGFWNNNNLGFAHTRLKIVDLSDSANQPVTDGEDVLIFNGEIFNYKKIKSILSGKYNFKTNGDSEVLFYALKEWKEEALQKIDGQFAFAFFNLKENSLLLARDHAGICPLYLYETENNFYFSSEIRPILSLEKGKLDKQGLVDYFFYRYNIQNGFTLFEGIKRFHPAHFLKIDLSSGKRIDKRYWRMKFEEKERSEEEIQKEFNSLVDNEVTAQRMGDVPVGMYLSGGIDSGALLVGFANSNSDIKSFTLAFSKQDEDLNRVEDLSKQYKFTKNVIEFNTKHLENLEEVIEALEDPFGDLIICANYLLAQNASKDLTVVLSGEGGDESFCGYDHQRAFMSMLKLGSFGIIKHSVDLALKMIPAKMLASIKSYPGGFGKEEKEKIRLAFKEINEPATSYIDFVSLIHRNDLSNYFSDNFKNNFEIQPDIKPIVDIFEIDKEPWQAVMRSEIEQLILIMNLTKQDRFSMHFSMEGRVPFVSRNVLNFAASLGFNGLFKGKNKKYLQNYGRYINIKKKPFSLFSSEIFIGLLLKLFDKYVTKEKVLDDNILSWQKLTSIRENLSHGNILAVKIAMNILVFQIWYKVFREKGFIN